MHDDEEQYERFREPPAEVTREIFLKWRSPRSGEFQAQDMSNPVWEWLVRSRLDGYRANERFEGPDSHDAGPVWCCDRFGQTSTKLSDGRVLLIAGEHEDGYDPDFYIYNDVIVLHPGGGIQILTYPVEAFPRTDFHTATLIGEVIILIGNLGHPDDRQSGETQVLLFHIASMKVVDQLTSGESPGWIHGHEAKLSDSGKSIVVKRGKVCTEGLGIVENIDEWGLHLNDFHWERLTRKEWPRFQLKRRDGGSNRLFEMGMALWDLEYQGKLCTPAGWEPPSDPALFKSLYVPPVPHENLPEEEEDHRLRRICVGGVTVRYQEEQRCVTMTVEGSLPEEIVEALCADLRGKLERVENSAYEVTQY